MTGLGDRIRSSQVWQSVVRHGLPQDRRGRALAVVSNLFLHIHPVEMRRYSLRFWFTWGMGWLTFVLFVIEVVSGIALMFYYRPSAEHAYADMQALRAVASFGLVREIHRWGAHAMVLAAWLHMLRVFLTGSYKRPREFNWCIGVGLLVLTMLLSFTGYLLPWDQLAIWAVTVGTNMVAAAPLIGRDGPGAGWLPTSWDPKFLLLGGESVGPAALLRFYVLHCAALPALSAVLIGLHFWRVRKDGGISGPQAARQDNAAGLGRRGGLHSTQAHGRGDAALPPGADNPHEAPQPSQAASRPGRASGKLICATVLVALPAVILPAAFGSWTGVKDLVNWSCRPERLLPTAVGLLGVGLIAYRRWSRPPWAALLGALFVATWVAAACDAHFRQVILEPDNVPITLMVFTTAGFLWLGLRRMAINDERSLRGLPSFEAEDAERVMVWPNVLMVELVIAVMAMAGLIVWAILLQAPLEAPADPASVPNPSKAPWYFVGLQELLVYFDPWIAGFLLPVLTVFGLCALPYLDVNPRGNGYYTLRERRFSISVFLFGFVILWLLPIVIGTFLRGPNWSFFGPLEPWDPHRVTAGVSVNLSELIWTRVLGRAMPGQGSPGESSWLIRELPALLVLAVYLLGVPLILGGLGLGGRRARMGWPRFAVLICLLTIMGLFPIKMLLRWMFQIKYIVSIPEAALSI